MAESWKAPQDVQDLCSQVVQKSHSHLEQASFVVVFTDSKPYTRDRLNFGKVSKFSDFNKLFQSTKYDYCINICADVWRDIISPQDHMKLMDLLLSCCTPEYEPETVEENGKKKTLKDEWGRVKYTNQIKYTEEGVPKWLVTPLDIVAFVDNAHRYGLWFEEHVGSIKDVVSDDVEDEVEENN
jgi:hypothetical protein